MKMKAYHFGYQGHKPEDLLLAVEALGAVLCDIRYAPYSRQPGWSKKALVAMFGAAYRHIPELGNLNYKGEYGAGIRIADLDGGLETVFKILERRPVVVMCVCREFETCHRLTVAEALQELGVYADGLDLTMHATIAETRVLNQQLGLFRNEK